jgi:hypothetical protein
VTGFSARTRSPTTAPPPHNRDPQRPTTRPGRWTDPRISAGRVRCAEFLAPTVPLVFRSLVDHVPAAAQAARTARVSCGVALLRAWAAKSRGDADTTQFDGHVVEGRFGLHGVPAGPGPVTGHVLGGVPVQRIPHGDHAESARTAPSVPRRDASDCGPHPHQRSGGRRRRPTDGVDSAD